jgi:hypothetical protein
MPEIDFFRKDEAFCKTWDLNNFSMTDGQNDARDRK